jgi:hypothetical protein
MDNLEPYVPGPAYGARAEKTGEMWKLILVRELHHAPEKVWRALTQPVHLREWAPFEVEGDLTTVGATVKLTWLGTGAAHDATVTEADAPRALAFGQFRWELDPVDEGTRLTLWTQIPARFITWGAAGWHICFDVLDRLLRGTPVGRIAGSDATKFKGWHRLVSEYAEQFGMETSGSSAGTPKT